MGQAMGVVVVSSLAAGIGSISTGGRRLILVTIAALVDGISGRISLILSAPDFCPKRKQRPITGELLRTIGFSSSPGLIRILGIIPGFTNLVFSVAGIWMLIAMVIAVRQALDYTSTLRAVGVCLIGWIIQSILVGLLLLFAQGGA